MASFLGIMNKVYDMSTEEANLKIGTSDSKYLKQEFDDAFHKVDDFNPNIDKVTETESTNDKFDQAYLEVNETDSNEKLDVEKSFDDSIDDLYGQQEIISQPTETNENKLVIEKFDQAGSMTVEQKELFKSNYPEVKAELVDRGDIRINTDGSYIVKTRNMSLEGKQVNNDRTGEKNIAAYCEKELALNDGTKMTGVFLEYKKSYGHAQLPENLRIVSDEKQMKEATNQLSEQIEKSPEKKGGFTSEQFDAIKNGNARIPGLTWHHDAESGSMSLVDSETHEQNRHTGGNVIWGGGQR